MLNPLCQLIWRIAFTPFTSTGVLLLGVASIVANLMFLDIDIIIATLLTYMMSIHNVTSRYRFRILAGTDVTRESIMGGFLRVVFPFRDPMSGPNICSAASTLAGVTGQFDNPLLLSASTKVAVLGHPIII